MPWRAKYPFAYHVFPLHLARDIWREGALLSKKARRERGLSVARPTTAAVDEALGFEDVVHFYLPRAEMPVVELPILTAQLRPARLPPFPHAVLRIPVTSIAERSFYICCWNIAVSRPACPSAGVQGGNWTRGTAATRIAEVWNAFRGERPDRRRARGRWVEDMAVPLLPASEVSADHGLLRLPRNGPELLIPSKLTIGPPMSVLVFSARDELLLRSLGGCPGNVPIERASFPGYEATDDGRNEVHAQVESYLRGGSVTGLHFDRVRAT